MSLTHERTVVGEPDQQRVVSQTECVDLVTPQADEQAAALMTELDDIPAIPADAAGLRQVFMNLLTNALEAIADKTGPASGVVTLSSEYDSMNRHVVMRIMDNGPGIGPDELPQIFQPFWSSKGQGGTGLGLAVARKIVQEHRGRLEVASTIAEGTTFTIVLPAIHEADASETSGVSTI